MDAIYTLLAMSIPYFQYPTGAPSSARTAQTRIAAPPHALFIYHFVAWSASNLSHTTMSSAIACVAAPVRAMSLAPAKASKAVAVKAPVMKKTSAFQVCYENNFRGTRV
jgi:hypothetical protein